MNGQQVRSLAREAVRDEVAAVAARLETALAKLESPARQSPVPETAASSPSEVTPRAPVGLTVREVATGVGVSTSPIGENLKAGRLRGTRHSFGWRVRREDVDEWKAKWNPALHSVHEAEQQRVFRRGPRRGYKKPSLSRL